MEFKFLFEHTTSKTAVELLRKRAFFLVFSKEIRMHFPWDWGKVHCVSLSPRYLAPCLPDRERRAPLSNPSPSLAAANPCALNNSCGVLLFCFFGLAAGLCIPLRRPTVFLLVRLLSMLNHHEKLMRLQNSASHIVCQEKFRFIILSIDSCEQPYLYPRQLLLLPWVQVCVLG